MPVGVVAASETGLRIGIGLVGPEVGHAQGPQVPDLRQTRTLAGPGIVEPFPDWEVGEGGPERADPCAEDAALVGVGRVQGTAHGPGHREPLIEDALDDAAIAENVMSLVFAPLLLAVLGVVAGIMDDASLPIRRAGVGTVILAGVRVTGTAGGVLLLGRTGAGRKGGRGNRRGRGRSGGGRLHRDAETGKLKLHVKGIACPACDDVARLAKKLLGEPIQERQTAEYSLRPRVRPPVRPKGGQ